MGRVLIVRNHGEFLVAVQEEEKSGKLPVLTRDGKIINVNPHQVVYRSELYLHINEFENWSIRCEEYLKSINLREIWELIQGEIPFISFTRLSSVFIQALRNPSRNSMSSGGHPDKHNSGVITNDEPLLLA